jgi:hypothetical protein
MRDDPFYGCPQRGYLGIAFFIFLAQFPALRLLPRGDYPGSLIALIRYAAAETLDDLFHCCFLVGSGVSSKV